MFVVSCSAVAASGSQWAGEQGREGRAASSFHFCIYCLLCVLFCVKSGQPNFPERIKVGVAGLGSGGVKDEKKLLG